MGFGKGTIWALSGWVLAVLLLIVVVLVGVLLVFLPTAISDTYSILTAEYENFVVPETISRVQVESALEAIYNELNWTSKKDHAK